jgi:type I restriction enzyme M protein
VATDGQEEAMPLDEALVLLREAEEEREVADKELDRQLKGLGLQGWRHRE